MREFGDFCLRFDFGTATAEVEEYSAGIAFAGGASRFPLEKQFAYCPVCGRKRSGEVDEVYEIQKI
jgi:hypothetical protein